MIQKNLDYLKRGLQRLGFGEKLNADLEKNMADMPDKFHLRHPGEFGDRNNPERVDFALDFKKSKSTDMYFLNRYTATLRDIENPDNDRSHTFYITKNNGVSAREAFNLLQGRAVNKDMLSKEGEPYNAWIQLNFKEKDERGNFKLDRYHTNYGYDSEKTLNKYSIGALTQDGGSHEKLLRSLSKGDLSPALFVKNGREERIFIEANPKDRNLNIHNAKGEKMDQANYLISSEKQKMKKGQVDSPDTEQKTSRRQGMSVS